VRESQDEFDRRGVAVAVVSFAEPAKLIRYQDQHRWPFPLFADPKRDAYRAFTLERLSWLRVFSPATLRLYFKLTREGRARANYGKEDIYQGGGDFLLDRAGNILFAHRGSDPADRPPVEKLLEVIDRNPARKT
jgi:peroxiredoxin